MYLLEINEFIPEVYAATLLKVSKLLLMKTRVQKDQDLNTYVIGSTHQWRIWGTWSGGWRYLSLARFLNHYRSCMTESMYEEKVMIRFCLETWSWIYLWIISGTSNHAVHSRPKDSLFVL